MSNHDLRSPRSIDDVRGYLRAEMNCVLRRPGMYGGELAIRLLFDALAFADGLDDPWRQELDGLRARKFWTATGLSGALEALLPDSAEVAASSIYSEFAHRVGWLICDRQQSRDEHEQLLAATSAFSSRDASMREIVDKFGQASVLLGGTNPHFPKTLLYASTCDVPIVCFHLWNTIVGPDGAAAREDPILLAVRVGGLTRDRAFTFTPEGRMRSRVSAVSFVG